MKQLKLSVSHRDVLGSSACKRLRKAGQIPAVIYGKSGVDHLTVDEKVLRKLMRATGGSATLIEVTSDKGIAKLSVIEKLHREPTTGAFLHVDFHEVLANEEMHATLPVHTEGESIGAKQENGVLEVVLHHVEVKCLPKNLPEYITIDISDLHVGQSIHLKSIPPMTGVTVLGDPETVIVSCSEPRKLEEEPVVVAEVVETVEVKEEPAAEEAKS